MAANEELFFAGEELSLEVIKGENALVEDGVKTELEASSSLHIFDAIKTESLMRSIKFNNIC